MSESQPTLAPGPPRRSALDARALTNAAFVAALIGRSAQSYNNSDGLPLAYSFLVPVVVLNETVRDRLPKNVSRQLSRWVADNPIARSELRGTASSWTATTRAALRFGLRQDILRLTSKGVVAGSQFGGLRAPVSDDASACWKAADLMGRWLARSDDQVTTLTLLGLTI